MLDHVFEIVVDEHQYKIVLPHWETDYIQGILAKTGEPYELSMLRAMAINLQENDLVLDVGANIGNHSIYLAMVTGCRVFAFEPNPELCIPFQQSIILNNLEEKITLHQAGVGEVLGNAYFEKYTPDNLGGQSLKVDGSVFSDISIISLDSLCLKNKVRVIKIDVEGMEQAVLKGARELIIRDKPYLFVEAQTEVEFETHQKILSALGYICWETFNATPTHYYIHRKELDEQAVMNKFIQKALENYKFRHEKKETQDKLNLANKKYKEANEYINDLKVKLNSANEKYKDVTMQSAKLKEEFKDKTEKLRIQLLANESKLVNSLDTSQPAIIFDFSIDDNDVG